MAAYDSAYLLTMFLRFANRPPAADATTTATYYQRLSEAQQQVVADLASILPEVLYPTVAYGSIPTLTTTDNKNYTFGTDPNGYALSPMGSVAIFRQLADIPSNPLQAGVDYIPLGGTMIQAPNNQTLPSVLYWRGITPPGTIDASGNHEPLLFPEASRELIALRAVVNWAMEGARNPPIAAFYSGQYGYPLVGNPGRFAWWCSQWRTQYRGGGVLGTMTGLQVASGSSVNYAGF